MDESLQKELDLAREHLEILGVEFPANPVASWIDRGPWLQERMTGVGSSEVWKLFSPDPDDRLSLYLSKTEEPELLDSNAPDLKRGRRNEGFAIEDYCEETGREIIRIPLLRCEEEPLVIDNPDGLILPYGGGGEILEPFNGYGAAEVKIPRYPNYAKYKNHGVPERIVLQDQHHILTLKVGWCENIVFHSDSQGLVYFPVGANEDLHGHMIEAVRRFWHDHVVPRNPPKVDDLPVEGIVVDKVEGVAKIRTDEPWLEAAQDFAEAQPIADEAKKTADAARAILRKLVGKEYGVHEGGGVRGTFTIRDGNISWKDTFDRVMDAWPVDSKKLKVLLQSGELQVLLKNGVSPVTIGDGEIQMLINELRLDTDALQVRGKPVEAFRPTVLRVYED